MPTIIYCDNHDVAVFNGYSFRKDKKTGYYLSSKKINGTRKRLHVYVWEYYNGTIPKGYHIHHINHNKDDNEINNLEALPEETHRKRHIDEMSDEEKQRRRENLFANAQPKAIEWHKSEKGRDWHKEHYEQTKDKLHMKQEFVCEYCGKTFTAIVTGKNRFCSNNCKSAYRRKSGVDNIERECAYCGKKFITNKYSKAKFCEKHRRKVRIA